MRSDQLPRLRVGKQPNVVEQVAEHLAHLIADGLLAPGEKLPGETVLARRLGVSRPTLREAIGVLRGRGLVEVRPRSGTFVGSALDRGALDAIGDLLAVEPARIWDLLEIRRVVDAGAAALAAERRSAADLAELRQVVGPVAAVEDPVLLFTRAGGRSYGAFFARVARATQNTLYSHLVESVARMIRNAFRYSQLRLRDRPGAGELIRGQLLEILDAIERSDPAAARRATLAHLEFVERALRAAS